MTFDNFSIRLITNDDDEAYFDLIDRNRPRLEAFFSGTVSKTKTHGEAIAYVKEMIAKAEQKTYLPFLVIDNTNGAIAGFIDIKNIDWNIPKGELGCFIDVAYESKGISTRAFRIFTDYCFETYGFKKLFLRTHQNNFSACKVAENSGFEIEGVLRRDYKTTSGELVDLRYYGKLSPN